ncbi:MAG TPA: NADH-quinone oxidoreductase subunit N [Anaeromyxobacter sp.]|nr:NADH-quinone oxidoreductase subunit N [Anaeromyxobacter sp.]
MTGFTITNFGALLPVAILSFGAIVLLLSEVFLVSGRRGYQSALTVVTAAAAAVAAVAMPRPGAVFGGQATVDGFSVFVTLIICAGLALSALVGAGWLEARGAQRGEFYALATFAAAGMVLLGMARDFLTAFVSLELMSISTYALAAYLRRGLRPSEAAFKYLVLGAVSSGLFVYGAALLYGATGSTLFEKLTQGHGNSLYLVGMGLVLAGVAFKVAAVPFHAWTPDVYEGAPTPVTAFMAAGVKTAAFALLVRIFLAAETGVGARVVVLGGFVSGLAILTMFLGNLLALPQRSVKRMLAYSSIAHAGYLLIGVVSAAVAGARNSAIASLLFYLAVYCATVIGAFAVVGVLERRWAAGSNREPDQAWDLARFAGLGRRRPGLAFAMTLFMLSLAGVPPTAGFFAKLYLFRAAVSADFVLLALVGVLTSALGAYYYLRVVLYMYMRAPEGEEADGLRAPSLGVALAVAALVVVFLGIAAEPLVALAAAAGAVG